MKKLLLLSIGLIFITSCSQNKNKIAEDNILTYLKSHSKVDFEVNELQIMHLDTITDLHLLNYLFNHYDEVATSHLKLARTSNELAESNMNMMNLSKSLNNAALFENYKSDFKKYMNEFKVYNDSAAYYSSLMKDLDKIKPDSTNFVIYQAVCKYSIVNKDKTAENGEDMSFFLNNNLNILTPKKVIEMSENKFLKK